VRAYHYPHGHSYRRWHHGDYLPSIFFVRRYWIIDFYDYGLFDPPYGFVWVRYGPDALLIDRYSGEIVLVIYDVFYW
jgi:Ni/Co efflux regulator RcnB